MTTKTSPTWVGDEPLSLSGLRRALQEMGYRWEPRDGWCWTEVVEHTGEQVDVAAVLDHMGRAVTKAERRVLELLIEVIEQEHLETATAAD